MPGLAGATAPRGSLKGDPNTVSHTRRQRRIIAALVTPLAAALVAVGAPHDASAQGTPSGHHNHGTGSDVRRRNTELPRPAHGDAARRDSPAQMAIPALT